MTFSSDKTEYICVGDCLQNETNDVYICKNSGMNDTYYLWAIKDHRIARQITGYFEKESIPDNIDLFTMGTTLYVVFPYKKERNLEEFFSVQVQSLAETMEICCNMILLCMTSGMPVSLLYILLKQKQWNLGLDRTVYFSYAISLENLEDKTENDCTRILGKYIQKRLEESGYTSWSGYRLLKMKNEKFQYRTFAELYKDMESGILIVKESSFFQRLKYFIAEKKPTFFRVLKRACLVIGVVALFLFISKCILGENIISFLFVNSFKTIGTESMLQ